MGKSSTIAIVLGAALLVGCSRGTSVPGPKDASVDRNKVGKILAYAKEGMSGCDHDVRSAAVARHAWPYPAEAKNILWGTRYKKMELKLKPVEAAFVTATLTWKEGELIEVQDSDVVVHKPRRVVAKHDLHVTRKVWDQGTRVSRTTKAVSEGEDAYFLFYNSRGFCLIETEDGAAWTRCSLDGSFEGVSSEEPFACEQTWWVKVGKNRIDRGWMPFDEGLMMRVPPPGDAAK